MRVIQFFSPLLKIFHVQHLSWLMKILAPSRSVGTWKDLPLSPWQKSNLRNAIWICLSWDIYDTCYFGYWNLQLVSMHACMAGCVDGTLHRFLMLRSIKEKVTAYPASTKLYNLVLATGKWTPKLIIWHRQEYQDIIINASRGVRLLKDKYK